MLKSPPDFLPTPRWDVLWSAARFTAAITILAMLAACGKPSDPTVTTPPSPPDATPRTDLQRVELPNAGFEDGEASWKLDAARSIASVTPEAAAAGTQGLRLDSPQNDKGVTLASARLPVEPGLAYRLTWQARVLSGTGTNVFLRFFDAAGKELQRDEGRISAEKGRGWMPYRIQAIPPENTASLDVFIQRPGFRTPNYQIDLDAFELASLPIPTDPPWPGTYKIRATETARLTAADVVGPDGRVYPDFTWAGVPGGIPQVSVALRLEELGAKPGADISGLLETAAAQVAATGGGAVLIGEGTYHLDAPVIVLHDNVVFRGAGSGKTKLLFRYRVPMGEIRFFRLAPDQEVGMNGAIEFHANPKNLVGLELRSGERSLSKRERRDHWGNTFSLRISGSQAIGTLGEGTHPFTAIAEYSDGRRVEQTISLRLVRSAAGDPLPNQLGAISFVGRGPTGPQIPLKATAERGSRTLGLAAGHGLAVGDKISLVAPASERWKQLVGHSSHWDIQAQNFYEITAVDESSVTLSQPLRVTFLVEDAPTVQKVRLVQGGGVEGLLVEQIEVPDQGPRGPVIRETIWHAIEDLWTSGIITHFAWGCWMKDVTVRNTGRNSAYFLMSKHIEVRDCLFDEAIFKGGGGTGYVGFDRTWDSLIDTIEVRGMRHAPNNQWNAAGNVVRNSRFLGSDGQWHAGWTLENLYENNFIDARGKGGSYGHGLYASGPTSGIHGPQGPRNVVYNNDIVSRKDGLHMLGGNEAWMVLFNRFQIENGRAVYAREKSFDHIIANNVFILTRAVTPPVFLGADSAGVELVDNAFYGVTPPLVGFAGGKNKLLVDKGNVAEPVIPDPLPARPSPPVPSIYQWQMDNLAAIRARQAESQP